MNKVNRNDPRYGFFLPFYRTQQGQILVLATPSDQVRDGLALSRLIRYFPLPEYEGIRVEPARPGIQLDANLMLVGSAPLFVRPDAHPISGNDLPTCVGAKLGARLSRIDGQCCYRFEGGESRVVVNGVTGERYEPRRDAHELVDYGVIRRIFRGPLENTLILEGGHRPGTLGSAWVATDNISLEAIWDAVRLLPEFDETAPLEILVRTTVEDERKLGVYGMGGLKAVPLFAVYDRQWVYDLSQGSDGRWKDQLPWDVHVWARGDGLAQRVDAGKLPDSLPRLEIEADLAQAEGDLKDLCRRTFENGPENGQRDKAQLDELLRRFSAEAEGLRVVLVDKLPFAHRERVQDLPEGGSGIRAVRKQFFVHLALGRFVDRTFRCTEESVRRCFPRFSEELCTAPDVAAAFIGRVPGRLREGFEPALGEARAPKGYLRVEYSRKSREYRMCLERSSLVLKVRL